MARANDKSRWHVRHKTLLKAQGKVTCRDAYLAYYGISQYQFYEALKCVREDQEPVEFHGNKDRDYCRQKSDICRAFLIRVCEELAEGLPTGFHLELSQRVEF